MSVMHRNMADKLAVSAQGCYIDNTATRDLPTQVLAGMSDMTIEACISACASASYKYAAVQVHWIVSTYDSQHVIRFVDVNDYLNYR